MFVQWDWYVTLEVYYGWNFHNYLFISGVSLDVYYTVSSISTERICNIDHIQNGCLLETDINNMSIL